MEYRFNQTFPKEYIGLLERSGHKACTPLAATGAIKNSLFTIGIVEGEELIAFGRVTGDDALVYIVCDIMVDSRFAGYDYEVRILKEIDDYLRTVATRDSQVILIADSELGALARKFKFKYFDSDFYAIMKR